MTTLYGLKNCDTCKKAQNWLKRFGIDYRFVDYRDERPSPDTLVAWKDALDGWESMVNKSSTTWRQLPPNRKTPGSDAEWKLLLKEYPQLVRRPVVVREDGSVSQGFTDNGFKKLFGKGSSCGSGFSRDSQHDDVAAEAAPTRESAMSDVLQLTSELISRPSVTPDDAGCQALIAARLQRAGFHCESLRFGDVDNLWAMHGDGGPVLALLGHTDVVPPGPREAWRSDPFSPEVRDGVLYGRGAADMKGSVAAFVVALERFVATHPQHRGTIALLLTSDEEGDAVDGVRRVAEAFRESGQRIDWCITGEPSSKAKLGDLLRIGRRGTLSATVTVKGIQGHVAYPDKARNPIHLAMPALSELAAKRWDDGYETFPPTSLQISNLHAGTGANNVIPGELQVLFNLRYNPHWQAEKLESECEAVLRAHGLGYSVHWHRGGEPFFTPEGSLRSAARDVLAKFAGEAPEESTGGGTSDARFIAPLGAQCIEVGPVNASIHKVDEHVSIADLEALPDLYFALIERLLN